MNEETKVTVSFTCDADVATDMIALYGMMTADTIDGRGFSSERFWTAFPAVLVFLTEQAQQIYDERMPHHMTDLEQKILEYFLEAPTALR